MADKWLRRLARKFKGNELHQRHLKFEKLEVRQMLSAASVSSLIAHFSESDPAVVQRCDGIFQFAFYLISYSRSIGSVVGASRRSVTRLVAI